MSSGGQRGQLTPGEAPPPDAALLAALAEMKPVRPRSPGLALAALGGAAAALATSALAVKGLRADLGALPVGWVTAMALAWVAGLTSVLLAVTLPRRGEVLPDTARAGRTALMVTAGSILLGLVVTVDAPGATIIDATPAAFARHWWLCTKLSLLLTAPFLLIGGLLLRRLFPLGGLRAAAALGAAGGAMAGLTLHLHCPVGGGLHVGLAHAGGVALGALLGMLVLPRLLRS